MRVLRTLVFTATFYGVTTLFLLFILPGLVMPYHWMLWYKQTWLGFVIWLLRHQIGLVHELRGQRNIPAGPVIFAVKHQSIWETLGLSLVHAETAIVLKQELTWIPIFGWYLIRMNMIPIRRAKGTEALRSINRAAQKVVDKGRSVMIFPQGTRTAPGTKAPYLPGVAALYNALGIPVVPIALNSGLFWPRQQFRHLPGTILVEYLEPIPPGLKRKAFMNILEERIEAGTARLEAEARRDYPWVSQAAAEPGKT